MTSVGNLQMGQGPGGQIGSGFAHRPEVLAFVSCAFPDVWPERLGLIPPIWAGGLSPYAHRTLGPILQRHPTVRRLILRHPEGLVQGRMTWYHGARSYAARPHLDRARDLQTAVGYLTERLGREVHLYVGGAGREMRPGEWMREWAPWADTPVRDVIIDGSGNVTHRGHRNVAPWIRFADACGLHLTAEGPPAPGSIGERLGWSGYATDTLARNILTRPVNTWRRQAFLDLCAAGRCTIEATDPSTIPEWHALGAHVAVPITRLDQIPAFASTPSNVAEEVNR